MADYGTKYYIQWESPSGPCRVELQLDGYGSGRADGTEYELTPGSTPFQLTWGSQGQKDIFQPLLVSTAKLRFLGDDRGRGLGGEDVAEVFDAGDTEWRVRFLLDGSLHWQGYLATDLWKDNPKLDTETVELEAIDGLALLETEAPYGGSTYTLSNALIAGLQGLHNLPISTSMNWREQSASIPWNECPLDYLSVTPQAYTSNRREQLEDIAERFLLQVFQAGGEWHIRQTSQVDDGYLKRYKVGTSGASFGTAQTDNIERPLPTELRTSKPRSRVQRLRTGSSVYEYEAFGEVVDNGGFENGLGPWQASSGGGFAGRKPLDNTFVSQDEKQEDRYTGYLTWEDGNGGPSTLSQTMPKINVDNPAAVFDLRFDFVGTEMEYEQNVGTFDVEMGGYELDFPSVTITDDALKTDEGELQVVALPGDPDTVVIPAGAVLPVRKDISFTGTPAGPVADFKSVGQMILSEPAYGGDTVLRGKLTSDVDATESGIRVHFYRWRGSGFKMRSDSIPNYNTSGSDTFHSQKIRVPLHTPNGDRVAGTPSLEWQVYRNVDAFGKNRKAIDNVSLKVKVGDEEISSTSHSLQDDHYGRNVDIKHRIGGGPTAVHPQRIHRPGTAQLLTNWKAGSSASYSGKDLDELTAEMMMRRHRETLDRRTYTLKVDDVQDVGKHITPEWVYSVEASPYEATYLTRSWGTKDRATIELTEIKDAGATGLTRIIRAEDEGGTGGTGGSGGTSFIGPTDTVQGIPDGVFVEDGDADTDPKTQDILVERIKDVSASGRANGDTLVWDDTAQEYTHSAGVSVKADLDDDGTAEIPALGSLRIVDNKAGFAQEGTTGELELDVGDFAARTLDETVTGAWDFTSPVDVGAELTVNGVLDVNGTAELNDTMVETGHNLGIHKTDPTYSVDSASQIMGRGGLLSGDSTGTEDYVAKRKDWQVSKDGRADFRSLYVDELVAKTFTSDVTQALAGSDILAKSASTLSEDFTIPSASSTEGDTSPQPTQIDALQPFEFNFGAAVWAGSEIITVGTGDGVFLATNQIKGIDSGFNVTQYHQSLFTNNVTSVSVRDSDGIIAYGMVNGRIFAVDADAGSTSTIKLNDTPSGVSRVNDVEFSGGKLYVSTNPISSDDPFLLAPVLLIYDSNFDLETQFTSYDVGSGTVTSDDEGRVFAIVDGGHIERVDSGGSWKSSDNTYVDIDIDGNELVAVKSTNDVVWTSTTSPGSQVYTASLSGLPTKVSTRRGQALVVLDNGDVYYHTVGGISAKVNSGADDVFWSFEGQYSTIEGDSIKTHDIPNAEKLVVDDLPGSKGQRVFEPGDWVRMRFLDNAGGGLVVADVWGTVHGYSGNDDGTQAWAFYRGDTDASITGGTVSENGQVVDYGQSGQGLIRRTTEGSNAPYSATETWKGNPIDGSNYTTGVIVGNLDAAPNLSNGANPTGYGLYGDNVYLEGTIVANSGKIKDSVIIGSTQAQNLESITGAQNKADAAESSAESYADNLDSTLRTNLNNIFDNAVQDGTTIIQGGFIKTDLIQTSAIAVGDFSDDGTYTTPAEAQAKADAAESSAKNYADDVEIAAQGYADSLDSTLRNNLNSIFDSAVANGTTIIQNGFIKTGFIQTSAIAVGDLSDDGTYTTPTEAQNKADAAQSAAESYADGLDSGLRTKLNNVFENAIQNGTTIIQGGLIKTDLIDTSNIFTKDATVTGTLTMDTGLITNSTFDYALGSNGLTLAGSQTFGLERSITFVENNPQNGISNNFGGALWLRNSGGTFLSSLVLSAGNVDNNNGADLLSLEAPDGIIKIGQLQYDSNNNVKPTRLVLDSLPTSDPNNYQEVWVDSNGYLRMST